MINLLTEKVCHGADRPWKAVGMDGFMTKPVTRDRLRQTLLDLEYGCREGDSPTADAAVSRGHGSFLQHQDSVSSVLGNLPFPMVRLQGGGVGFGGRDHLFLLNPVNIAGCNVYCWACLAIKASVVFCGL